MRVIVTSILFLLSKPCFGSHSTNRTEITACPDYGIIENANVAIFNIANTQAIRIECNSGYHLIGKHKILCVDGRWDDVPRPECKPSLCTSPPDLKNGVITIDGEKDGPGYYRKGTLVTYMCNEGFRLHPSDSKYRVCEKTIWTGATGKCVPLGCKPPKGIDNGYYVRDKTVMKDEFAVGVRVYYNCNSGYVLNGAQDQLCLDDGTWLPRLAPVCALEINGKLFNSYL